MKQSFENTFGEFSVDGHEISVHEGRIRHASASRGDMLSSKRWREGDSFVLQLPSTSDGRDETQYIDRYGSFLDASPLPSSDAGAKAEHPSTPGSAKHINYNGGNK